MVSSLLLVFMATAPDTTTNWFFSWCLKCKLPKTGSDWISYQSLFSSMSLTGKDSLVIPLYSPVTALKLGIKLDGVPGERVTHSTPNTGLLKGRLRISHTIRVRPGGLLHIVSSGRNHIHSPIQRKRTWRIELMQSGTLKIYKRGRVKKW